MKPIIDEIHNNLSVEDQIHCYELIIDKMKHLIEQAQEQIDYRKKNMNPTKTNFI